jgi:rhamnosyltransferase
MAPDVSIVIPVKNGGDIFEEALTAVFAQNTSYSFEVVCIDSGSTDDTLETIGKFDCKLIRIPPEEFGHGKTRKLGAEESSGEFLVFLTHDATPANGSWLQSFIEAMEADPEIAGGFGKHVPYPDADIFTKRDLTRHFANFGEENTVFQLTDENRTRYEAELMYRMHLCFFSDNNSCIRRSAFEAHPYRDVAFAEDQVWAKEMIELGAKKLYCPNATVYHSHSYTAAETAARAFDEYKGLYDIYGYRMAESYTGMLAATVKQDIRDARYALGRGAAIGGGFAAAIGAMAKNAARNGAGYAGGRYHEYSDEKKRGLDEKYSQLLRQKGAQVYG